MTNHARNIHKTALTIFATALAIVGAGGCADDSDLPPAASPPATTTEAPGLDLTPAEQEAIDEARTTFDNFMNAYVEVAQTNEIQETAAGNVLGGRALDFLTSPLREDVQREVADNWQAGQVQEGILEWTFVEVASVDLERRVNDIKVPEVVVRYCIDATGWVLVDEASGTPTGEPGGRHVVTIRLSYQIRGTDPGPSWQVAERDAHSDQSC